MTAITLGLVALVPGVAIAQSAGAWESGEYRAGWQLGAIDASTAYSLGYTGQGVVVGVLDSGIDARHPEFRGRLLQGYDFTNGYPIDREANFDTDTHGTHVSGIIAANRNGTGMHGVAFDARVMPMVLNQNATAVDGVFSDAWRLLADRGVSIVNNSLGINNCAWAYSPPCNVTDYTASDVARNFPGMIAAMKYAAKKDVLMVFATGNEAQPAPDALGGMPYLVPELRDNWIAVGAVDRDGSLASFSNRCGVAAEWCLVAPGVGVYSTMPLGQGTSPNPDYMPEDGTSMATPVVSGVAALVKEAFPFFTAKDLQQTLLTTATDMGDRARFGWGMVNAGKAVRGYGRFVSDVTIDTKGFDATFGNDIDGAGALTKTGDGMLTMTGANTYRGSTSIVGGGVSIDGSVASTVLVGEEGLLRGTGTISAPLYVAGRLAPGNSPGTLTVAGPVFLGGTSVSQFDIDGTGNGNGAGNHSRLVTTGATGTIDLDGTLVANVRGISGDATNGYVAPLGARFDIIEASAGLTGSFDTLVQPGAAGLERATRFDTVYDASGVSIAVTPQAYGDLAANGLSTTDNQDAVGAALDELRPESGPRSGRLFSGLYTTGAADLPSALAGLSGEIHASATALQVTRAEALHDTIDQRLRAAFAADEVEERATFWSSAYGGWGSASGGQADELDWGTANLMIGADAPVGDFARIGLAAGTGRSKGDVDAQDAEFRAGHYDIAAYGSASQGAFQVSVAAAHSWSSVTTSRTVEFGTFAERLSDSYRTRTASAFGEVGYRAQAGAFELNPFVSGALMAIGGADIDESGGIAALSGSVASRNLGLTVTGVRVSRDFVVGAGRLTASAMLGWQHLYGDTSGTADLQFAGGTPFSIDGVGLARDAARVQLGADYTFNEGVTAGLGYRGTLASSSSSSSVRGNLRVAF